MRLLVAVLAYSLASGSLAAETQQKSLTKRLFSKKSFLFVAGGAVWSEISNSPREWGRGAAGLGKRVGSSFGKHLVKGTVQFGVATLRHEDLNYHPSEKPGFGPRVRHALISTVVTRRTSTGRRTPALGRITGSMAGGFVSRLWMPTRLHTFASGFGSGGISLGVDAGLNVAREFWPEIRHPLSAEKRRR